MGKLFYQGLVLLVLFFSPHCYAASCSDCSDCPDRCCVGDYEIGVDFLWWQPCIDDLIFCGVREQTTVELVEKIKYKPKGICPSWEPGMRFWFRYPELFCWCDMGFKASYTYVKICTGKRFQDENLIPTLVHPGLYLDRTEVVTKGSYEADYHELEALIYFNCCSAECHSIEPSFGLAALFIEQALGSKSEYITGELIGSTNTKWKSENWGVGLRMGMDYNYYYSKCLSYYAFGKGTIIASNVTGNDKQSIRGLMNYDLSIHGKDSWTCIPGFHLGVGAIYDFCVCDFDLSLRVGYEFLKWFGLSKQSTYFGTDLDDEIGLSTNCERCFGFNGLNVGLSWCF